MDSVFWSLKKFFDFCLFVIESKILVLIPWKNSWKSNLWKDTILQVWDIAVQKYAFEYIKGIELVRPQENCCWLRTLYIYLDSKLLAFLV